MPTLTIEIKKGSRKPYPVSFLVCSGNTKKRIPTGIKVSDSELSANGRKIKSLNKARLIESKRLELQDRLDALLLDTIGQVPSAEYIVQRITSTPAALDFFTFSDQWLEKSPVKGKKNYICLLNALERHIGHRTLPFSAITYAMLDGFAQSLNSKPRAQSLYLGLMRHLYREAMRTYNTDYDQPIANDPFLRYKVPRQVIHKGVRALTLEQIHAIAALHPNGHSRAQLARDTFLLSFCLMGMNSVDLWQATDRKGSVIRYCRAKTKDRRDDQAYIEVTIQPQIAVLFKRYQSRQRVFNFYQRYKTPQDFNRAINIGLKTIGKDIGVPTLTFYQARHTFATLSRNLMRFSKSDVDEALDHVGALDIADIYIAKDFSIINDNNARLLQTVFPKTIE